MNNFFLLLCSVAHFLSFEEKEHHQLIWEPLDFAPRSELILYWNGTRPSTGRYTFLISVQQKGAWSPWIYYAEWGSPGQIAFRDAPKDSFARSDEGVIKVRSGLADRLRVQLIASGGADLQHFTNLALLTPTEAPEPPLSSILIEGVPRQSQITLRHPRYLDLSLPVSLTILLNHYLKGQKVDPLDFVEKVIDDDTAAYETWTLNLAEASHRLSGSALVHFTQLPHFAALHAILLQGTPVLVSLSGWIPSAPRPYRTEHALCVIGFDEPTQKVICIDPAFPNDKSTFTSYDLAPFLKGWSRHGNKAVYLSSGGVLLK